MTTPAGTTAGVRRGRRLVGAMLSVGLLLAACADAGGSGGVPAEFERTAFDPVDFVDPTTSTNRWHPLRPGLQWTRQGTTEVGERVVPHQVVSTMTDVVREIDGAPAIAMLDLNTDAGELVQVSVDYFGLDRDGNVWLLGSYTEDYSGGEYTDTSDAWLGGAEGAEPGILMPGDVGADTPAWFIGREPDGKASAAEVVETGRQECVEFACYDDVLVVREGEVGALDNEFKYYAAEVGQILNSPRRYSRHQDDESLVNLTELSDAGLDEMSSEVLRLEEHARETVPEVFGAAPPSSRVP
ncbi:hypothetical protein OF117_21745 [Geodermatophilus sp. YIM 151500]|uniref:hypothetical protein n=1 Tax=Geodermatophilus sp. YIM 151500 TaxID=2984531 RepID=UPI0021E4D635|nr:hypothetical protein [Geodermatophilus sp. YIM 151500]MCV2491975.1 hypothetical protein [Geodermatophilus sp. YIM 151500]